MSTKNVLNKEKGNGVLVDVSKNLFFRLMKIGLLEDGEFEISIEHDSIGSAAYEYITTKEAKQLIAFLQAQIKS